MKSKDKISDSNPIEQRHNYFQNRISSDLIHKVFEINRHKNSSKSEPKKRIFIISLPELVG